MEKKYSLIALALVAISVAQAKVAVPTAPAPQFTVPTTASGVNVKIGGKFLFNYCSGHNQQIYSYLFTGKFLDTLFFTGEAIPTHIQRSIFTLDRGRIIFTVVREKNRWNYSFNMELTGDANSNQPVREIYGKVEHPEAGVFVFGDTKGVEDRMVCGPSNFLKGSGGTGGAFFGFVNVTTGCSMDASSAVGDTKNATKIMYLTPRVGGFQFGVSYTPNTNHLGEARMNTAFSQTRKPFQVFDINSRVLGVNYLQEFRGGLIVNLSMAHLAGNTRSERPDRYLLLRDSTDSWDCGAVFSLGPWALGTEYIWNGKSGILKNNISSIGPSIRQTDIGITYNFPVKNYQATAAGKYYSVNSGIAYTAGDMGISFSYFYTRKNTGIVKHFGSRSSRSIGRAWAISTEYNLAPGFCPYLEGAIYRMSNPDWPYLPVAVSSLTGLDVTAVPSNKARMVLAGIKVQF